MKKTYQKQCSLAWEGDESVEKVVWRESRLLKLIENISELAEASFRRYSHFRISFEMGKVADSDQYCCWVDYLVKNKGTDFDVCIKGKLQHFLAQHLNRHELINFSRQLYCRGSDTKKGKPIGSLNIISLRELYNMDCEQEDFHKIT